MPARFLSTLSRRNPLLGPIVLGPLVLGPIVVGAFILGGSFACHNNGPEPAAGNVALQASVASQEERKKQAHDLHELGLRFTKSGDTVRAEHYLNAAIQAGYPEETALPELISVCIGAGRLRSALGYAEPRLRQRSNDVPLRYLVATLYLGLEQIDSGVRQLNTVLELDPKNSRAYYTLGVVEAEQLHDEESARRHFERFLELAPQSEHFGEVALWLRQHRVPVEVRAPEANPVASSSAATSASGAPVVSSPVVSSPAVSSPAVSAQAGGAPLLALPAPGNSAAAKASQHSPGSKRGSP